jgi:hypothetical protein
MYIHRGNIRHECSKKLKPVILNILHTGGMYGVAVCSLHLCNYGTNIGWAKGTYSIYHVARKTHNLHVRIRNNESNYVIMSDELEKIKNCTTAWLNIIDHAFDKKRKAAE